MIELSYTTDLTFGEYIHLLRRRAGLTLEDCAALFAVCILPYDVELGERPRTRGILGPAPREGRDGSLNIVGTRAGWVPPAVGGGFERSFKRAPRLT